MIHSMKSALRLGTRGSPLALWQANHIADRLRPVVAPQPVELQLIETHGDRDQASALSAMGGFGVFTKAIQQAILDNRADVAVHSLKDLPTDYVEGLMLAATPTRGLTADALVMPLSHAGLTELNALPQGARVGTGSPRRQAQLRYLRPDLQLSEVRGNVETRLRKLDEGQYEALVLAAAGLTRLGLRHRISRELPPPTVYPAVGQGAIGVECRTDDARARRVLALITHGPTQAAVTAERSLLATLRAGCHAPLGVSTQVVDDTLRLEAVVLPQDGSDRWIASASGTTCDAAFLGQQVAQRLLIQGAGRVLHAETV